jgi:hypothetical protein
MSTSFSLPNNVPDSVRETLSLPAFCARKKRQRSALARAKSYGPKVQPTTKQICSGEDLRGFAPSKGIGSAELPAADGLTGSGSF